jgi:hypothetical protein
MQTIDPNFSWYAEHISPTAGNPRIEEKAFSVASYGKQLGLLTEVVLALVDEVSLHGRPEALGKLRDIQREIEALKPPEYEKEVDVIMSQVLVMQRHGGEAMTRLTNELQKLIRPAEV